MKRPPRSPKEDIINTKSWWKILSYGMIITLSVIGCLSFALFALKVPKGVAVTMSFFTIAFAQLFHVFNMRETESGVFVNEITRNFYIWMAVFLCSLLMFMTLWIPSLKAILKIHNLDFYQFGVVAIFSLSPLLVIQAYKIIMNIRNK